MRQHENPKNLPSWYFQIELEYLNYKKVIYRERFSESQEKAASELKNYILDKYARVVKVNILKSFTASEWQKFIFEYPELVENYLNSYVKTW